MLLKTEPKITLLGHYSFGFLLSSAFARDESTTLQEEKMGHAILEGQEMWSGKEGRLPQLRVSSGRRCIVLSSDTTQPIIKPSSALFPLII
jgi:hypothetical protein